MIDPDAPVFLIDANSTPVVVALPLGRRWR